MKFQMPIPQSTIVDIEIYLRLDDRKIFYFLKNIKEQILQLEENVTLGFNLYYPLDSTKLDNNAKLQISMNCLPFEDIFSFMPLYYDTCLDSGNTNSECFYDLVNSLGQDSNRTFQRCVAKDNSQDLVKAQMKKLKENSISHLMINMMTYHGSLKPENVFEAICGAFLTSPVSCLFLNNKYSVFLKYKEFKDQNMRARYTIYAMNFLMIVVLLIIAAFTLYFIYNKIYQRILSENVANIVRDHISNYQSLRNNE